MYRYSKTYAVNSPIKASGAEERPQGALSLERGHFHLPVAFYIMKIGQSLAVIWQKTSRNPTGLGSKGGAFIGGSALIGEFTLDQN